MNESTAIPIPRESVNDESVTLLAWRVARGEFVHKGQPLAEVEGGKAAFEIYAPQAGHVYYSRQVGEEIPVGEVLCHIGPQKEPATSSASSCQAPSPPLAVAGEAAARNGSNYAADHPLSPAVRRLVAEERINPAEVPATGRGGRLTKEDVIRFQQQQRGQLSPPALPAQLPAAGQPPGTVRFSRAALNRLEREGLAVSSLPLTGLIRERDLQAYLAKATPRPSAAASADSAPKTVDARGIPFRAEQLPRGKRTEIKYLESAHQHTLPSTVSVAVPTRGFRAMAAQHTSLRGLPLAVFIYECARLLAKYPYFNATYCDGTAHLYEAINIGIAMDAGKGLKVPVVRNADRLAMPHLAEQLNELLIHYLNDEVPATALQGGTFTVTDLSAEGVLDFVPRLNQGQSAILGIGAEFFPAGGREGFYKLTLTFDHQLSEGRQAARFLSELSGRLQARERALRASTVGNPDIERQCCSECSRTYQEVRELGGHLAMSAGVDGAPGLICTTCLAGF